jgi:hypothetical protein
MYPEPTGSGRWPRSNRRQNHPSAGQTRIVDSRQSPSPSGHDEVLRVPGCHPSRRASHRCAENLHRIGDLADSKNPTCPERLSGCRPSSRRPAVLRRRTGGRCYRRGSHHLLCRLFRRELVDMRSGRFPCAMNRRFASETLGLRYPARPCSSDGPSRPVQQSRCEGSTDGEGEGAYGQVSRYVASLIHQCKGRELPK